MRKKIYITLIGLGTLAGLMTATVETAAPSRPTPEGSSVKQAVRKAKAVTTAEDNDETAHTGDKYILFGKSMYDGEENIFAYGGKDISYPLWIDFSDSEKVAVDNLIDLRTMDGKAAYGTFEEESAILTINTPYEADQSENMQKIGLWGGMDVILTGGTPYGLGYLTYSDKIIFNISSDKDVLTPQSGFAGMVYSDGWCYGFADVIYDAMIFRVKEGISFHTSTDKISFDRAYVGNTYKAQFSIYNSGTEPTDFVVTPDGSSCISIEEGSGILAAGEKKDLTILFTPDQIGSFNSSIIVESEEEVIKISVEASAIADENYNPIVTEGDFAFKMDGLYPWVMSEINGQSVAVSSNSGLSQTESSLTAEVTIPVTEKGILSFGGQYDPRYFGYDRFFVTVDDKEVYAPEGDCEFNQQLVIGPGHHIIKFVYDKGVFVDVPGWEYGTDVTYLSSLSLKTETVKEFDYTLDREFVDFGRFFEGSRNVTEEKSQICITNKGYAELKITEVKADTPFSVDNCPETIASQTSDSFEITVTPGKPGTYRSNVVLSTNAGDITIPCAAVVEPMPDFSGIVKTGEFTFDTDRHYPYEMKDGKAINSTAKDDEVIEGGTLSYLTAYFSVPEGSVGNLRWKGSLDAQASFDGKTPDLALLIIDDSGMSMLKGKCDVTQYNFAPKRVVGLAPGEHSIYFSFSNNVGGDPECGNYLEISELTLDFEPIAENRVELWDSREIIDFGKIFANDQGKQDIYVANTGSVDAPVTGVNDSEHFKIIVKDGTTLSALSRSTVRILFCPDGDDGQFDETVQLITSAGAISIPCTGYARPLSDILLFDDFEDPNVKWTFFDRDSDSDNQWHLSHTGENNNDYAHKGAGCLASDSKTKSGILPDNYAVSPEFTIPEEGAELTWWAGATAWGSAYAETYDVILGQGDDMSTYKTVFTETLGARDYHKNTLDLSDFKGKTVSIVFRHHSETPQSTLVLDDVMVAKNFKEIDDSGVKDVITSEIVKISYYNMNGIRIAKPTKGIYVRQTTYSNGMIRTEKVTVK